MEKYQSIKKQTGKRYSKDIVKKKNVKKKKENETDLRERLT